MSKKKFYFLTGLVVLGLTVFALPYASYFLADPYYENLIRQKVKNKAEVESNLFFYSTRKIKIEDSLWGKRYKLKTDEYCQQYRILNQPIDVVYNSNDEVVTIFSSYE